MDKSDESKGRWRWLPDAMPGVARLIADRRREVGAAHVNACWQHGVLHGKPGWFFAREGALAVGTPWVGDAVMADFAALQVASGQPLLCLRDPEATSGAN